LVDLGTSVVAIDPDATALQRAIELGAIEAQSHLTGDEGVDAVLIATPATSHERDVLDVAELGVPVACEKPLTVSSESAARIVDAVGDRLTVLHVWRYHPGVELLGELARSGRLGTVNAIHTVRTNWTSPRTDIDPVWTLLPHDLSIAIEILGHLPEPTSAVIERIDGCAVGIWATFGTDPALVVDASTRGERRRDVRVHGTEAVALLNGTEPYVRILSGSTTTPREEYLTFDATPALRRELAVFVEHVRGGDAPKTDAKEGLAVVAAVERALALGTHR
jgi:predicted dehydrogenase